MSFPDWLQRGRSFFRASNRVLTMNQRNLEYIYPNNARRDFPLADNKLKTKQVLAAAGVPVPETYRSYASFFEMRTLEEDLTSHHEFVIKPAQGSGGGGIMVISGKTDSGWVSVSGKHYTLGDIRKHLADIIFGVYSFGLSDQAIIERRVDQHAELNELSPFGLTDVRVITYQHQPALAMLRVPTQASDGKANLHQGALGVGIDLASGRGVHATFHGESIAIHPDTSVEVSGFTLPYWDEIMQISRRAAEAVPLKYLGVDLAVSTEGPLVLEINVRPGIEIQNANMSGMRPILKDIKLKLAGDSSEYATSEIKL